MRTELKNKKNWLTRALLFLKIINPVKSRVLFLQVLRQYIAKEITEQKLCEGTIRKYETFLHNIEDYFKAKKITELPASEIKIKHMEELKLWLHNNLVSCSMTHSARHQELCKRSLRYAVQSDYILFNPLDSLETKRDRPKEIINLEQTEFIKLCKASFAGDLFTTVQHLYLFQAVTGLSHCDIESYEIASDRNGNEWIQGTRRKSGIPYNVPLHPLAKQIHHYYRGKLPVLANGTYNRVIKEIADQLGFKKHLTTHTARKTFATLNSDAGWSTESIMLMLGQSSIKTTEVHYVKRSRKRIEKEMLELKLA